MMESSREPGGFIPPQGGLPSPAPSSASSRAASSLPHPRRTPLRPGGSKEEMVRRYAEEKLMTISRRYVKKFGGTQEGDDVVGFRTFGEVCKELDEVVNILWQSGTPILQVQFLLRLASDFTQYVRSFPPSPKASFDLLHKLDHCFASLLCGQDIETKETLPGFENGLRMGMTTTDMVRCRSLVEQTRLLMVEIMSGGEPEDEEDEDTDEEDEGDGDDGDGNGDGNGGGGGGGGGGWGIHDDDDDDDETCLDAARVYQHTIVQLEKRLGDSLGGNIGGWTA
ncbi:hypothetical protein MKX07_006522 [Trichoderma sp. CBMAI-0711]|nr:hypothetical protein MKX07_006522 [Trichoderma sp. CBMAI-0711]